MDTCEICGKPARACVTDHDGGVHEYCMDCQNDQIALQMGIEHFKDYIRTYVFKGHTFNIQQMIYPGGIEWQAQEEKSDEAGYYFALCTGFHSDPHASLQELYKKINRGVVNKFLSKGELHYKYQLKHNKGIGRIEYDQNNDNYTPLVIIDGKKLTWIEFGHIVSTYEGFNLKFSIIEPGEDDGVI